MKLINENTPTIVTDRLILRRFVEIDVDDFFALMSDQEVNQYLPLFVMKEKSEAAEYLDARFIKRYNDPFGYRYAVCLKSDNRPIGYVVLSDGDAHDFGYALSKEHWNCGIITEAASAILDRIVSSGLRFITATHDVNNPASGEVMKKLGMTYRYSYREQWQPKNISVVFRMYQLNFQPDCPTFSEYSDLYENFVEKV